MQRALRRLSFAVILLLAPLVPATAQTSLRAAAVVNDEVISVLDLEMRLRLVLEFSGMDDSPAVRERLAPQVLRTLIDERLQLQEAERLGIEVAEQELRDAVASIASRNNMTYQPFVQLLERRGVMPQTLFNQLRAQLAWQKVVRRRLRAEVDVTEEDVEAIVERILSSEGQTQVRVAEIFLAVDDPSQEEEVRRTARRLIAQLRQGADFAALARQFSQSATAAVGGELGWIQPGRLPEELSGQLQRMRPGEIAGPVQTYAGLYILQLRDRRELRAGDEVLDLSQLYLPLPGEPDQAAVQQATARARDYAERLEGCDALRSAAERLGTSASGEIGDVKLSQLPDAVRDAVVGLDIGQPSQPVRVDGGVVVLMVCERQNSGIDRELIRRNLVQERLNMLARRHLRDLRRSAHVDIRL